MIQQHWQQYLATRADRGHPPGTGPWLTELPWLAVVRFQGSDVRRFLQGYLTCDTDDLENDALLPAALCNLQGRVVVNGWCRGVDDGAVDLLLHDSLVDTLAAFLRPYLMFSRTQLLDERPNLLVLGGMNLPDEVGASKVVGPLSVILTADVDRARTLWERFGHHGDGRWLAALTESRIPMLSAPVSARFLPQMLDLDKLGAIDFGKGCYLGQEVVARAQHRGSVKRRLALLHWQGAQAPVAGTDIAGADGRPVGVVVQSAAGDSAGGPVLAVLQTGVAAPLRAASPDGDVRLV
jgi:tRNA-modifying protein YgfZ